MRFLLTLMLLSTVASARAADDAPWGVGNVVDIEYEPHKVVYDVAVADAAAFERVLDRASYLSTVYNADPFRASIVLVLHGDELPFFDTRKFAQYEDLMRRAQSLTVGGTIELRMCRIAAAAHGMQPEHIHGFVQIIPMADAEIVRLQQEEGYVYMR
ncbi:MAG: hypothetical protein LOY58_02035 [Gammaproteobacteria bacterium]|nr:hypothetical protein [Gammaproteobacteria bacterium]